MPGAVPLTVIVPTLNEQRNLPACLASVAGWAAEVFVVDSGSADETVALARRAGATVVPHPFESFPAQWNWALQTLPIRTPWVLALDADQRVSPPLRDAIAATLPAAPPAVEGYYVMRRLIFRGRPLRWGGCTRPMLKLFRAGRARCDEQEAPDMHFYVAGPTGRLPGMLLEDNRAEEDFACWVGKQRRYARMMAAMEVRRRQAPARPALRPALWGAPDQRILWQKQWWARLPRYVRPGLYFLYRYVGLGGLLDGWPGLLYHSVQGFWLRWQVDLEVGRLRRQAAP